MTPTHETLKMRIAGMTGTIAGVSLILAAGCTSLPFLGGGLSGSVSISPPSSAPSAPAGSFAIATVGDTVTLNGSQSGGQGTVTAAWTQIAGPPVAIANANMVVASFVPEAPGLYQFQLTLTDTSPLLNKVTIRTDFIHAGDIQFVVPSAAIAGNPATVTVNTRSNVANIEARARVFDPDYTSDDQTQMLVRYELVSVPTGARAQDVTLNRSFDTISNQGTGDQNSVSSSIPTLDGAVDIAIRPNPDANLSLLTNLATVVTAKGVLVTGAYTFRATVTNPAGQQRSRILVVTLVPENFFGPGIPSGPPQSIGLGGTFLTQGSGASTVAVKQLPAGSPGRVTDKVMLPGDTATMVVSVFPSSDTSYRFFLVDNNGVANSLVAQDKTQLTANGSPQDITLTIASSNGLPVGTHRLLMESFDGLANVADTIVEVNKTTSAVGSGTPVRFHVTTDFRSQSAINAATVGSASNAFGAPVKFEGWSGTPTGTYGNVSALGDVNGDGASDIVTVITNGFDIRTRGFVDGSTSALRHPDNSGNFNANLGAPNGGSFSVTNLGVTPDNLAVGDLNGDGLPDLAVAYLSGGVRQAQIYFNTGNPLQPYSNAADQGLIITAPVYTKLFVDDANTSANTSPLPQGVDILYAGSNPAVPTAANFAKKIAIADINSDGQPDLVLTDTGYGQLAVYNVAGPRPAALNTFYNTNPGRVYVFNGGSGGQLKPGRPRLITSNILFTGHVNTTTHTAASADFTETGQAWSQALDGANPLDAIGAQLAVSPGRITASNSAAPADGVPLAHVSFTTSGGAVVIPNLTTLTTTFGGVTQSYVFDSAGGFVPGAGQVRVDITGAGNNNILEGLRRLVTAVNGDANRVVNASTNTTNPLLAAGAVAVGTTITIDFSGINTGGFGSLDASVRGAPGSVNTGTIPGGPGAVALLVQTKDGIVERNASTNAMGNAVKGIANSDMGLGWFIAMGNLNSNGGKDDLLVSARDDGSVLGRNDGGANNDGALYLILDGSTNLPAQVANLGADTAVSLQTQTNLGRTVGVGDVTGDGIDDAAFTESGFDRIYIIKGAATPANTPDITITGVDFSNSLTGAGSFLFGDVNGDTEGDWMYLDSALILGFAGHK